MLYATAREFTELAATGEPPGMRWSPSCPGDLDACRARESVNGQAAQ